MSDAFGYLLRGIVAGLIIAAPVGPVNVLCIRRTLEHGRTAGFVSGLGAAVADALYGAVAAFGLQFVAGALFSRQAVITVIGGLFIIFLGAKTIFTPPPTHPIPVRRKRQNPTASIISTFLLTLTNPSTIISFGAIFAWLGLASAGEERLAPGLLTAGVFLGSTLWWLIITQSVGLFRKQLQESMVTVNRTAGGIIIGLGVVALILSGR